MNTFTFVFTDQELNVIFGALQEKPYKEAAQYACKDIPP